MDNSKPSFLPYEATDINESSVLANQKEINESPETRDRCLEILRQELKNIKDIYPCLDDSFLLMFLRVSKFNTQKALLRLQRYYQQCDILLDAFKKCSLPLHRAQSFNHLFISPYRMKNNSLLLIAKNKAVDYRNCTFAERFYLEVLTMYGVLENPVNQLCGSTFLFDYEGFDIHGLLAYTPGWIRIFLSFLLNAAPCRLKAVHIINAPTIFSAVFNIGYPFLHKKIRERLYCENVDVRKDCDKVFVDEEKVLMTEFEETRELGVLPGKRRRQIKNEAA
ncbi:Alpha-tocopherol transfer protein-like [Araneus ventricosus]|uniref:Alpha-tocopherol transfer protein-like n=1 Tax=Araneus ventricosus TaxID=182803 RepID=A0A4Y2MZL3_ARAVE|nr:Alpha-tocopherol transfer protein-like [Araneus ventricosus]